MSIHSPVDIFRVDMKGVMWLESSASVDEAKARIQQLGAETSGEYVMLNQATGIKVVVKVDGASAA